MVTRQGTTRRRDRAPAIPDPKLPRRGPAYIKEAHHNTTDPAVEADKKQGVLPALMADVAAENGGKIGVSVYSLR
jgi:hypothetical protein